MLNPVPLATACEILIELLPEFAIVSETFLLDPTWTLPKLTLDGFGTREPALGVTPSPDTDTVVFALSDCCPNVLAPLALFVSEAEPVSEMLPLAAPVAFGVKTTVKLLLCPGPMVSGRAIPLSANAALLAEACDTVTDDPPGLVTITFSARLCPSATLPKLTVCGLGANDPAFTAFPVTVICNGLAPARLVVSTTLPVGAPAACGAKATTTFALCPGERVRGRAGDDN